MARTHSLRHASRVVLVLLACSVPWRCAARSQTTVAGSAAAIDADLAALASASAPADGVKICASLARHVDRLEEQSIMVFGDRRARLERRLRQLVRTCGEWQSGAPDQAPAVAAHARTLWVEARALYPSEALQLLPPLWSCQMHPELLVTAAGNCPICGMLLEPVYVTQPGLTEGPIIGASVIADGPLQVGKRADLRIRLFFLDDGRPVSLADLQETHTRKIHLLISDISETDYHHEHPEPVGDGEYAFSFTPRRPDTYRVWADLLPARTNVQQYSVADIPSSTPRQARLSENEAENRSTEVEGFRFELIFDKEVILDRDTVAGTLRVADPDGRPCRRLGVVMGAFGHFAAFGEDFAAVLHLHPTGPLVTDPEARSGPELPFYFRSNQAGLFRLFAQVRIDGRDLFPRFVVRVRPRAPAAVSTVEGLTRSGPRLDPVRTGSAAFEPGEAVLTGPRRRASASARKGSVSGAIHARAVRHSGAGYIRRSVSRSTAGRRLRRSRSLLEGSV